MFDNSLKKDVSFGKMIHLFLLSGIRKKRSTNFLTTYATWEMQMTLLEMKGQNDKSVEKDRGESHAGWRDY